MTAKTLKECLLDGKAKDRIFEHDCKPDYVVKEEETYTYVLKDLGEYDGGAVLVVRKGGEENPQMLPLQNHYDDRLIE